MPARKYKNAEEARVARLAQNLRWKHDNPEQAHKACSDWHARERAEGRDPNADTLRDPGLLMLGKARQRAKRYGLPCELDVAWLRQALLPMRCIVTDLPLTWDKGHGYHSNPWAPSIDRIKSSEGYTVQNSRIVCWAYNLAKSEWGDDVPMTIARALAERTF